MRPMNLIPAVLLLAAPMAAQDFTGTITMRTTEESSGTAMTMKLYLDGGRQAVVMNAPSGPMAGGEMRMVTNPANGKATMFITMPGMPGGGKGMKMEMDIPNDASDSDPNITVKPLGTSQTIAGIRCEDYEVTTDGEKINICGASDLGRFRMPSIGGMGRGNANAAWTRAFGNRPVFPLKVWTNSGTAMEVTSIERGAVDQAMFDTNTPGYMNAPGIPGGRRN